jgi:hypothetical protein
MNEPEPDTFDVEDIEQDDENDDAGKAADERRNRRISWVASCLVGIFVAAAVAGPLSGLWPKSQLTAFLLSFFLLAPLLSIVGRWLFIIHPDQIAKKLQEEDRSRGIVSDDAAQIDAAYIEDEEEHQDEDPEPIHPG